MAEVLLLSTRHDERERDNLRPLICDCDGKCFDDSGGDVISPPNIGEPATRRERMFIAGREAR